MKQTNDILFYEIFQKLYKILCFRLRNFEQEFLFCKVILLLLFFFFDIINTIKGDILIFIQEQDIKLKILSV